MEKETLTFIKNDIKCSFFEYPYRLLKKPQWFPEVNIFLASDEDMISMKAVAIMQRGLKKDFFDLYFLIKEKGWDIQKIVELCQTKYGNIFSPQIFLKTLIFFEDAETQKIVEVDLVWPEIKKFLVEKVEKSLKMAE
jgi:hypothetical protein